jgi:hypothetical protein
LATFGGPVAAPYWLCLAALLLPLAALLLGFCPRPALLLLGGWLLPMIC